MAGHLGIEKTINRLRMKYFWQGQSEEIKRHVQTCVPCQMRKKVVGKPQGLMQFITVENPFDKVGIDLLGPFPETKFGMKHIMVVVDYFTKWVETKALESAKALDVANAFVQTVILRHGAPESILSDRGKAFISEIMTEVFKLLKTNHNTTVAYHPQCNGLCERQMHTFATMLSMYVSQDHRDWDVLLPYMQFAYNISTQDSTRRTPFYLIYGREARYPEDVMLGVITDPLQSPHDNIKYENRLINNLNIARRIVRERLAIIQERQKKYYDKGRTEVKFEAGELVFSIQALQTGRQSGKIIKQMVRAIQSDTTNFARRL